jgi:hypothetical protein
MINKKAALTTVQHQQRNNMNYENAEDVQDDCEKHGEEEEDDATTVSRFNKQSMKLDHLMNLDDGVSDNDLNEDDPDDDGLAFLLQGRNNKEENEGEDEDDGNVKAEVEVEVEVEEEEEDETSFFAHVVMHTVDELLELAASHCFRTKCHTKHNIKWSVSITFIVSIRNSDPSTFKQEPKP